MKYFLIALIATILFSCKRIYSSRGIELAIENGDIGKLRDIAKSEDANKMTFELQRSLLHKLLADGVNESVIELCVSRSNDSIFNVKDSVNFTPLNLAFATEKENLIPLILSKTDSVNVIDYYDFSPMHYVAILGNVELIDSLVAKGAKLNLINSRGETPLHQAVKSGNLNVVEKLRALNVDETIKDSDGKMAKHYALTSSSQEITKLYFHEFSSEDKNFLLQNLIKEDDLEKVTSYLKYDWVKQETLNDAFVFLKSPKMAKLLLDNGVKVNVKHSDYAVSALHRACIRGDVEMIRFLLDNKANINQTSGRNKTPLMYASKLDSKEISSLNSSLNESRLPIKLSVTGLAIFETSPDKTPENSLASVKLLLERGAKLSYKNSEGETALSLAENTKNEKVKTYLSKIK